VRTDEQYAAPMVTEVRVGVEEVGGPMQSDDGLARAGWSAWMVLSTSRIRVDRLLPRLAMKADWSSSAACPSNPSAVNTSSQ
jgi:hypothetical protein